MGIDGTFEWVINNPRDIRPYAILVREKDPTEYRTLVQLITPLEPFPQWNRDYQPFEFDHFACIPGRIEHDGFMMELKRSHEQAMATTHQAHTARC